MKDAAHYKVIVLVLAADSTPYDELVKASRSTWAGNPPSDIKILYYYGWRPLGPRPQPGVMEAYDDVLTYGCEERMSNIARKTSAAFHYLLENYQFKYLFRCCAGSYLQLPRLSEFVDRNGKPQFYCGIEGRHKGIRFASGSGYFLSRSLAAGIVQRSGEFLRCRYADDVALGRALRHPVDPGARRQDINGEDFIVDPSHYHFHFRRPVCTMYRIHEQLMKETAHVAGHSLQS